MCMQSLTGIAQMCSLDLLKIQKCFGVKDFGICTVIIFF